jgi:multiple sugar transport system permease protein
LGVSARAPSRVVGIERRPLTPRTSPREVRRRRTLTTIGNHAVLIAFAAMFAAPMVFIVLTALMTDQQALSRELWPRPFAWSNFVEVWRQAPMVRYAWNTMQVAILSTVGIVVSCVPVAYALSRIRWPGREAVFILVLSTIMLPSAVTIVPLYIIFTRLHWIPSFKPLIIPAFFAGDAFSIFLLRQFFLATPGELSDAARVDGAGEFQVLLRVIVPLAKPAIAAVALFNFLYVWNDFFEPLLFLGQEPKLWTLSLGLAQFRGLHHVDWNLTMAASFIVMLPIILLFLLAQRVFMEGIKFGVGK